MKAWQLLSDPTRFRQGALAYDAQGQSCGTLHDSGAVKWDALGAIFWCYPNGRHNEPLSKDDPRTPCQKAREIAREKYNCPLGRLDWDQALVVLKAADV